MKTKSLGAIAVVVLVVAIAAVWYWLRGPAQVSELPVPPPEQVAIQPTTAEESTEKESEPAEPVPNPDQKPLRIYGTVLNMTQGSPIPAAEVYASTQAAPASERRFPRRLSDQEQPKEPDAPSTVTDEQGTFSLDLPDSTRWKSVVCAAMGYTKEIKPIPADSGGELRMDFLLRIGGSISGKVTDSSTGQAIQGITVQASKAENNLMAAMASERSVTQTDENGEYRLSGLPLATYRVRVRARELGYLFKPDQSKIVDLAAVPDTTGVDFALEPGATVVGTVSNPKQEPIPNAEVFLMPGQLMQTAMRMIEDMGPEDWMGLTAKTNEQGRFEIRGADFNTDYRLRSVAEGYAENLTEAFQIAPGDSPKEVNIVLAKGSTITGIAKYEDGAPAPKRTVTLMPEFRAMMAGRIGGVKSTRTQEDGSFRFENVAAGNYTLQGSQMPAFLAGVETAQLHLTVEPEKDITGLELTLSREQNEMRGEEQQGVINGTVLDPSGKPAAKVRVEARLAMNPMATSTATSKEDGTFSLTNLLPAAYDVVGSSDAGTGRVENVMPGATITLRLAPAASVSGVVVDTDGNPVSGCRVTLARKDPSNAAGQQAAMLANLFGGRGTAQSTDAVGLFEFKNVEPGRYTVEAKSDAAGTGVSQEFTVVAGQKVDNLRIVLDPGSEFSGIVENLRGEPVEGARVSLIAASNPMTGVLGMFGGAGLGGATAGTATSDKTGAFRIARVPAGNYTVVATHSDYARFQTPNLQIVSGRDVTGYRIRLTRGGKASGRLLLNGAAREGVMVQLMGPNGMYTATTDSTGAYHFDNVPPGRYIIQTIDMDSMMRGAANGLTFTPRVIDIADDQAVEIDLGIDHGVPVTGRINLEGASPRMVVYTLRRPGGPAPESLNLFDINQMMEAATYTVGQGILGADGTFRLDGVAPGTYILDVYALNFNPQRPDMDSLIHALQSPTIRQEIIVGDQPLELDFTIPGNTGN